MLERKKKSVIWKLTKDEFANLVKESHSIGEILKHFGLENKGGNSNTVKRRIKHDRLNSDHITLGLNSNQGRKFPNTIKIPLEEILVENSDYNRTHLKTRLVKENVLEYKCTICDNKGEWLGNKLTLQLDHINGIHNDNRKFNLRFICPNCHSQTTTYCGKQNKKVKIRKLRPRKFEVSKEDLEKLIQEMPMTKIGIKFNVSYKAIRKRALVLGIQL